jgi:2-oxoglutarate ferredoxin oxidoreductase subunit alpha
LKELPQKKRRVRINGNTAVAIGKIYAGIGFQSYYPITPASDESTFIEAHQKVLHIDPVTGEKGLFKLRTSSLQQTWILEQL